MDVGACTEPSFVERVVTLIRALLPFIGMYGCYKLYRGFSNRFLANK